VAERLIHGQAVQLIRRQVVTGVRDQMSHLCLSQNGDDMSILHLLNKTVTIDRDTTAADGAGGHARTPATIATLRAKIDPATAGDRTIANRDADRVTHVGYFEAGVDVIRDDVVTEEILGTKFKVLSLLPPSSPDHLKILMEVIL